MSTPVANTVLKAFEVLQLFGTRTTLRASDVAELLDLPRSSCYRLLVTLRDAGALDYNADGEFFISMRLFELGCTAPLRIRLHGAASDSLQRLAALIGSPVQLGIIEGEEVLLLEKLGLNRNLATEIGSRGPMHATALGKVLLAFSPIELQNRVLKNPLESFTKSTLTSPRELRVELEEIRRRGYAMAHQEKRTGYYSIARPVREPFVGGVIGAVSVIMKDPAGLPKVNRALERTCHEIEASLSG